MRGLINLLLSNFSKRKSQSILTAIIIIAATIMLTTAICLSISIGKPFEEMYKNLNASQVQIANMYGIYDTGTVAAWWEKVPGVTVQTFKCHYSTDRLILKGETLSDGAVFFTEKPENLLNQDKLALVEGEKKNSPDTGEVWVCISFAEKHKIKIGDILQVSTKNGLSGMKVTGIVADPQFGSPSMGVLRIWIASGELQKIFNTKVADGDFIGIHFQDYSKKDMLWKQFEAYLGKPFTASIFDYDLISMSYLMQYQIMGAILMAFAFILALIGVFIIAFTISAAIAADVKTIGILKAQGFTPASVTLLYASQFIALSIIFVPVGILLSTCVINEITGMLTKSMGVTPMEISLLIPGMITFIVILAIVGLVAFITASKAGKLRPVSAIREEIIEVKDVKAISFNRMLRLPISVMIAIRQLITQKKQSLLLLFGIVALAAVLTFSVNIFNTFSHVYDKASEWGFDKRSDTLSFKEKADNNLKTTIFAIIQKDNRIKTIIPVETFGVTTKVEDQRGKLYKDVILSIFDGDMNSLGVLNIEGRNPIKANEIAISINVKKEFGKEIGDYISVDIAGKKMNLLITGVYQSSIRMGWSLRAQSSLVEKVIPNYRLQNYALIFKNSLSRTQFINEYMKKYKDMIDFQPYDATINGFMYGTKAGINSFVILLGYIFTIVMVIIIFNLVLISIYREKKVFGMLLAIGMTSLQVRMTIVWRILILSALGAIIGIPLSYYASNKLMGLLLSGMGIVNFPMVPTLFGMLLVIPICLFIGFISSWVPSLKIKNISSRSLIVD